MNDVEEKTKQNYKQVPGKKKEGDKSDNKQSEEKFKQAAEMKINDVEEKTKQNYKQVPENEEKGDKSDNKQSSSVAKVYVNLIARFRTLNKTIKTNIQKAQAKQIKA